MNLIQDVSIKGIQIHKEVSINAKVTRVFEALTEEVSLWWGEPYLRDFKAKKLVLESKLGGKFYEAWDHGGMILGEVIEIKAPYKITLKGSMGIEGLVLGVVSLSLNEKDKTTLLTVDHSIMGNLPDHLKEGFNLGWENLLDTRLKSWIEDGIKYGLGHTPPAGTPKL